MPNSFPVVGGVVLLTYGDIEHIAYIQFIMLGGMWIGEGNYKSNQYTERFISFDDKHIRGFYFKSMVK